MTSWSSQEFADYFRPELQGALSASNLHLGIAILCMLLGACAYTDIWRGHRIPNAITYPLLLAGVAAAPILHLNPYDGLLSGLVAGTVLFLLAMLTGGIGGGDIKLYAALGLLLGPAIIPLYFISIFLGLLYGLALTRIKKRSDPGRKYPVPMAPGIALAFALTMGLIGASREQVVTMILLMVAAVAWGRMTHKPVRTPGDSPDEEPDPDVAGWAGGALTPPAASTS